MTNSRERIYRPGTFDDPKIYRDDLRQEPFPCFNCGDEDANNEVYNLEKDCFVYYCDKCYENLSILHFARD
ncbi:MAG: hypothetical protein ACOC22_02620 [bacterium]